MKCIAVAVVVIVALAATAVHASIVPLIGAGGILLPPLSYTAQTVDLNGLQATVVAGQPARLVSTGPVLTTSGLLGGQTVITSAGTVQLAGAPAAVQLVNNVPAAVQLATGLPAGIQLSTGVPAAIQVAPAVVPIVQAEGNYVAATRGAVHTAPLPGHAQSAAAINLEPAPGTL